MARQDSSPDIAHFVSGKFCPDLDFDMTWCGVRVRVGGGGGGWGRDCSVQNIHQTKDESIR